MAERVPLSQVRVGSTVLLPCKMTAKGAGGVTLQMLDEQYAATGTISITLAGAVSGTYTTDPRDQPVRVVAFGLAVNDVVEHPREGLRVVQMVNVDGDPNRWSPSTSGRPSYSTEDWEPRGVATIT
jgi:hypothetical protein